MNDCFILKIRAIIYINKLIKISSYIWLQALRIDIFKLRSPRYMRVRIWFLIIAWLLLHPTILIRI